MAWDQIEPTATHLSLMILSGFLILYAVFSKFIRNRLHLSEPPLATGLGILFGPVGFSLLTPALWGMGDDFTQEFTRIVLGVQCFSVGVELPRRFFSGEWKTLAILLGPVMAAGWLVCALLVYVIFDTGFPAALVISACLTPTDPILCASILSNSRFSGRVPARLRHILSAESGCNDGTSFPFLYIGLAVLMGNSAADTAQRWFLVTLLWQCAFGIALGLGLGLAAYRLLRLADSRQWIAAESLSSICLLLALFCVGIASTLGVDDFLVAFAAGATFAYGGWFADRTAAAPKLPDIIDLQLNSTVFVYFGARIPWEAFAGGVHPLLTPGRLLLFLLLVLLLRRLPVVLALKPLIPAVRTWREAVFAGHFGPMGVGALFLAIEARAQLETDTSLPVPFPPHGLPHARQRAVDLLWPIICFVVLGSTMVHGLSALAISVAGTFQRKRGERAPLLGQEEDLLAGMESD